MALFPNLPRGEVPTPPFEPLYRARHQENLGRGICHLLSYKNWWFCSRQYVNLHVNFCQDNCPLRKSDRNISCWRDVFLILKTPKSSMYQSAILANATSHAGCPSIGLPRNRWSCRDRPTWFLNPGASRQPSIRFPGVHRFCLHKWPSISGDHGAKYGHSLFHPAAWQEFLLLNNIWEMGGHQLAGNYPWHTLSVFLKRSPSYRPVLFLYRISDFAG